MLGAATLFGLILLLSVSLPMPASAQGPQCAPREALLKSLKKNYNEAPSHRGVTRTGSLLEVFVSPTGSWTILVTIPGGPTCLVSSGDGWHDIPLQMSEDPAV